jgi:hypothetical protein
VNLLEWLVARMKRSDETEKAMKDHEDALRRVQKLERERAEFEALERRRK